MQFNRQACFFQRTGALFSDQMKNDFPDAVGIIAEYNPFHNGHRFQLEKARELSGASRCVVLLSGHFVQRGEAALYPSELRAEAALRCGADAVFEIPAPFSAASARDYAEYGVRLLSALGIRRMACGTEDALPEELSFLAGAADEESPAFRSRLKEGLRRGLTYPEARLLALKEILPGDGDNTGGAGFRVSAGRAASLLSRPNNILAFEYAAAIRRRKADLRLFTVKRSGSSHGDTELGGSFSSASAIRREILSGYEKSGFPLPEALTACMPPEALTLFSSMPPLSPDCFCAPLRFRVAALSAEGRSPADYYDVPEDLANRILKSDLRIKGWEMLSAALKPRQYTHTRVARSLVHILLGVTKEEMASWKNPAFVPCARLLGLRKDAGTLLRDMKRSSAAPIVSKAADAKTLLGAGSKALRLLEAEWRARELWNLAYFDRFGISLPGGRSARIPVL